MQKKKLKFQKKRGDRMVKELHHTEKKQNKVKHARTVSDDKRFDWNYVFCILAGAAMQAIITTFIH